MKKKTIRDLKAALEGLDENIEVSLEGCDCHGDWNGLISFSPASGNWDAYYLLKRDD